MAETPKTNFDTNAERLKKNRKAEYSDVYDDEDGKKKGYVLDFHDQCFLMDFASKFTEMKGKNLPWAPRHVAEVYRAENPASKSFNSFLTPKSTQVFFSNNAPVEKLWNITPQLRLYKIQTGTDGKEEKVRLPFRQEITKNTIKLTDPGDIDKYYANIEEFSFNYEGVNPAEVDYYITANLRLYFNNVEAFFYKHKGGASYSDLIKRPRWKQPASSLGSDSLDRHRQWDENFFRIWVEIDYDLDGITKEERAKHPEFFRALRDQKIAFYLNILKHEFEIDKMPGMPFYLNIDYIAAVESGMNSREFADILGRKMSGPGADVNLLEQRDKLERAMNDHGLQEIAEMKSQDLSILLQSAWTNLPFDADQAIGEGPRDQGTVGGVLYSQGNQGTASPGVDLQGAHHTSYDQISKRVQMKTGFTGGEDELMRRVLLSMEYWKVRAQIEKQVQDAKVDSSTRYTLLYDELFGRGDLGLNDADIKANGYTRDKKGSQDTELMTKVDSNVIAAARRVYSVTVPGKEMHDYIHKKKRYKERLDQDRAANLKEAEKRGHTPSHEQLQELRKGAQQSLRSGLNAFWKRNFVDKGLIVNYAGKTERSGGQTVDIKGTGNEAAHITEEIKKKQLHDARQSSGNESSDSTYPAIDRFLRPIEGESYYLQWMYFGDIVDAALTIVRAEEKNLGIVIPSWYFWGGTGEKYTGAQIHDASYNIVFGSVTYDDNLTGKPVTIPISKIPVSLKLFNEFWTQHVIGPALEHYPFQQFLKDLLTYVMSNCFTSRCSQPGETKNRIRGAYDVITQSDKPNRTKISIVLPQTYAKRTILADHCPKAVPMDVNGNVAGELGRVLENETAIVNKGIALANKFLKKEQKIKKYKINFAASAAATNTVIYIYATSNNLDHMGRPSGGTLFSQNKQKNIPHIKLGQTTKTRAPYKYRSSPIKNISFSKTDQPFFLEAKGEQAGIKDNPLELSEPYNVSMTLFGNMAFRPGSHFYLMLPQMGDPMYKRLPDGRKQAINTYANQLGLGGYFMVTKCQNTVSADGQKFEWETEVNALWVGYPEKSSKTGDVATPTVATRAAESQDVMDRINERAARLKEVFEDSSNRPVKPGEAVAPTNPGRGNHRFGHGKI